MTRIPKDKVTWELFRDGIFLDFYTEREAGERAAATIGGILYQRKVTYVPVTNFAVWKIYLNCGKLGELQETVVCSKLLMSRILEDRPEIFVPQPFGKHSEADITLSEDTVQILTDDPLEVSLHYPRGNIFLADKIMNRYSVYIDGINCEDSDDVEAKICAWFNGITEGFRQ